MLTTRRLDALSYIFATIEKCGVSKDIADLGVGMLVQDLLMNTNSFLYKHLNRRGLALSSNLFKSIFESPTLLSNFELFDWPTLDYTFARNVDTRGVEVCR